MSPAHAGNGLRNGCSGPAKLLWPSQKKPEDSRPLMLWPCVHSPSTTVMGEVKGEEVWDPMKEYVSITPEESSGD